MSDFFPSSTISTVAVYPGAATGAALTFTSATYTAAARTLTGILPALGLGQLRLARGTKINITGGTGVTPASYFLEVGTSNSALTVATTITASDGAADIAGNIPLGAKTITGTYSASVFDSRSVAMLEAIDVLKLHSADTTATIVDANGHVLIDLRDILTAAAGATGLDHRTAMRWNPALAIPGGFGVSVSNTGLWLNIAYTLKAGI